jgi:hypothetical protein
VSAEPTRGERIERLLSIAVGIAAITAVVVSLYQASLARQQLRASAWPYLAQSSSYTPGNPYLREVSNDGVGPARIKSFSVFVDGKPVPTWNSAVRALIGEGEPALVYSSLGRGSVLPPAAKTAVLTLPPGARAVRFFQASQTRLRTVACYCSVYDECWTSDSDVREPRPTDTCADTAAQLQLQQ